MNFGVKPSFLVMLTDLSFFYICNYVTNSASWIIKSHFQLLANAIRQVMCHYLADSVTANELCNQFNSITVHNRLKVKEHGAKRSRKKKVNFVLKANLILVCRALRNFNFMAWKERVKKHQSNFAFSVIFYTYLDISSLVFLY